MTGHTNKLCKIINYMMVLTLFFLALVSFSWLMGGKRQDKVLEFKILPTIACRNEYTLRIIRKQDLLLILSFFFFGRIILVIFKRMNLNNWLWFSKISETCTVPVGLTSNAKRTLNRAIQTHARWKIVGLCELTFKHKTKFHSVGVHKIWKGGKYLSERTELNIKY